MTFNDFARIKGLIIKDLHPSDRIQRCPTENKPRSTNGAYFWDGRKGWVMTWDSGQLLEWFESDTPWTEREKLDWEAKRVAARMERMKGYALATKLATDMLAKTELAESPYLSFKGLGHVKAHVDDEVTLVPMRHHQTTRLVGLQKIWWDPSAKTYSKKFLPGMRAKGAITRIGRGSENWFVEGWATGLSLYEALKLLRIDATVIVCFSAGNLIHVAQGQTGFVFADNDASGVGEDAARSTGLAWTMSENAGWDANDVHTGSGLICLTKLIQSCRRPSLIVTTASIGRVKEVGGNTVGEGKDLKSSLASGSVTNINDGRTGSALWSARI